MKAVLFASALVAAASLCAGDMVLIKGGTFAMGSDKGKPDEKPVRTVTVSSFYMDRCEVTQKEYGELMGQNPSRFTDPNGPVERVRWSDCAQFCNARSQKEGLKPCYDPKTWVCDFSANGYRLPTEAEWEYACRAGSTGVLNVPGGIAKLKTAAWTRKNSQEKTHPCGTLKPNKFGLKDMYGNVTEWCNDWYAPYSGQKEIDPKGPAQGTKRVLRGGSWQDREKNVYSSRRWADDPATADICQGYDTYGFRCVRKAE